MVHTHGQLMAIRLQRDNLIDRLTRLQPAAVLETDPAAAIRLAGAPDYVRQRLVEVEPVDPQAGPDVEV